MGDQPDQSEKTPGAETAAPRGSSEAEHAEDAMGEGLMREFFSLFSGMLLIVFLVMGVFVIPPAMILDRATCLSRADKMGLDVSWGPLQGCMVLRDGQWEPIDWQKTIRMRK